MGRLPGPRNQTAVQPVTILGSLPPRDETIAQPAAKWDSDSAAASAKPDAPVRLICILLTASPLLSPSPISQLFFTNTNLTLTKPETFHSAPPSS
jgi:hypothetical protein